MKISTFSAAIALTLVALSASTISVAQDGMGILPTAATSTFPAPQANAAAVISMAFADTDVAQVLKAISIRTGASIVYVAKAKASVTLNLAASTTEEAIRSTVASAGLAYRKVGGVYIVAAPADMRQALEPYGSTVNFTMDSGDAVKALPGLQIAVPYGTARTMGNKIIFTGSLDDIRNAKAYIEDFKVLQDEIRPVTQSAPVVYGSPVEIGKAISSVYPSLTVAPLGDLGGLVMLTGPSTQVNSAIALVGKLDVKKSEDNPNSIVYRVYSLRYASGPNLTEFLKKAAPDVETFVGPESYSPPRAKFNPIGGTTSSSSSSGGSGSGGNSAGGGSASSGGGSTSGASIDHPIKEGDRARTIVMKGPQGSVDRALALVQGLDTKPHQVIVEVQVVETSPTFTQDLGIDWNLQNSIGIGESNISSNGFGFGTFTRTTPFSFTGLLKAKITRGEAKMLADPRVQVIDNDEAFIFIGDTIRAKVSQSGSLGSQTVDIKEFPIGIILLIRPRVNKDGNITMHVNPVVSSVSSVGADNIPQTSSREAETTVIVKNGQTIAIGGLIRDENRKAFSEVPFLSKLPIVGQLFRSTTTTRNRTDVIVTITPHLVEDIEAGK